MISSKTCRHVLVAALAVTALAIPLRGATGEAAPTAKQINSIEGGLSNHEIAVLATRFAAANGEDAPTEIAAVAASHRSAVDVAMPGSDIIDDGNDVDLVVIRGNFTGYHAKVPPGSPLPTGNVITLVIDQASGEVSDWSLSNDEPELWSLGEPAALVG